MRRRVAADHRRSYETPIIVAAGDRVVVVRRDDDAPDWFWCEHPTTKRAGWIPTTILDVPLGIVRRDHSAVELSVATGQEVDVAETIAGWTWCRAPDGTAGWVPSDKLAIAPCR